MSADSFEPLARLVTTADAVEGLRDLFDAEEPLDIVAMRVAETAVAAIRQANVVSITVLSWPQVSTAASTDKRALELDEQELVGSLNIYSHTATAFDPFDTELMRLYSVAASQAISNASRWQKARETVTQLERALLSRSDIDMAKGALIAIHGCDPPGAFARLKDESRRRKAKLRQVARELLAHMQAKS